MHGEYSRHLPAALLALPVAGRPLLPRDDGQRALGVRAAPPDHARARREARARLELGEQAASVTRGGGVNNYEEGVEPLGRGVNH